MDDSGTTIQANAVTLNVLANDSDMDGDALSVSEVTPAAGGSVVINADNSVTYTPAPNFFGNDSFEYTASDGQGGSAAATVLLVVVRDATPPTITVSVSPEANEL